MAKSSNIEVRKAELARELQKEEEGRDQAIEIYEGLLAGGEYSQDEVIAWGETINRFHDDITDIEGEIERLDRGHIHWKGDYMDLSSQWHY